MRTEERRAVIMMSLSHSVRERERERGSNLESDAGGSLYSQYRVQSAVSHQFSSNCLLMGQDSRSLFRDLMDVRDLSMSFSVFTASNVLLDLH